MPGGDESSHAAAREENRGQNEKKEDLEFRMRCTAIWEADGTIPGIAAQMGSLLIS